MGEIGVSWVQRAINHCVGTPTWGTGTHHRALGRQSHGFYRNLVLHKNSQSFLYFSNLLFPLESKIANTTNTMPVLMNFSPQRKSFRQRNQLLTDFLKIKTQMLNSESVFLFTFRFVLRSNQNDDHCQALPSFLWASARQDGLGGGAHLNICHKGL